MQFDQSSETPMIFGSPPDHDRSEKKGTFDWFHKRRHEHKERVDRKERTKSPPGSSSFLPPPHNMTQPSETLTVRGWPSDTQLSMNDAQRRGDMSNDITPTGTSPTPPPAAAANSSPKSQSPQPRIGSMAVRTDLPAALTEPRSIARSPDRSQLSSPVAPKTYSQAFPTAGNSDGAPQANHESSAQRNASASPSQPVELNSTPSGPHHASSNSTITVTPETMKAEASSGGSVADEQPSQQTAQPTP